MNIKVVTLFTLVLVSIITRVNCESISQVRINQHPNTVGAKKASLFVTFQSDKVVKKGNIFSVTIPAQATLTPSKIMTKFVCFLKGFTTTNKTSETETIQADCTAKSKQLIEAVIPKDLQMESSHTFLFEKIFEGPVTTVQTDNFKIQIKSADGKTVLDKSSDTEGNLNGLKPGRLTQATVKQIVKINPKHPKSYGEVGMVASIMITIETLNVIPTDGGVQLMFPKMLPGETESFFQRDLKCFAESGFNKAKKGEDLKCKASLTRSRDSITLIGNFPLGLPAKKKFSFRVDSLKNPYSMTPEIINIRTFVGVAKTSGATSNMDQFFTGFIDQSLSVFQALHPSHIKKLEIKPGNRIVQENDRADAQFMLQFTLEVPVSFCTMELILPSDYVVDTSVKPVRGRGVLKPRQFPVLIQGHSIKVINACQNRKVNERKLPTRAGISSFLSLSKLKNPNYVKQTGELKMTLYDEKNNKIAETRDLTYTPEMGKILSKNVSLVVEEAKANIGKIVDLKLTFTPKHYLPADAIIEIGFPPEIKATCRILNRSSFIDKLAMCSEPPNGNNIIEIGGGGRTKLFQDKPYPGNVPISFTFKDVTLPAEEQMLKGIQIRTYYRIAKNRFLVDEINDDNKAFFKVNAVQFEFAKVQVAKSAKTYTKDVRFDFLFRVANVDVPRDAKLSVEFPPEVTISDAKAVEESCSSEANMAPRSMMKCILARDSTTKKLVVPNRIDISGAFSDKTVMERRGMFVFKVEKGIRTPISKETTQTFKFLLTNDQNMRINYNENPLFVTILNSKTISYLKVIPSSLTVGEINKHMIKFTTPTPLFDGDKIYIQIPNECQPPLKKDLKCTAKAPLKADLDGLCQINGNRITVTVEKDTARRLATGAVPIPAETSIEITIDYITNPVSTARTTPYRVSVFSSKMYLISEINQYGDPIVMQKAFPLPIGSYSISALDPRQLALTTITIEWKNGIVYPEEVNFEIDIDSSQIEPQNEAGNTMSSFKCLFRNQRELNCEYANGKITLRNALTSKIERAQQLQLTFIGMKIKVKTPLTSKSWKMTSMIDSYKIDQISSGLSFTFQCTYPCKSCGSETTKCESCNSVDDYSILYESKCYQKCPGGTYYDQFNCIPCSPECKTCSGTSGIQCTSCDSTSEWPFLNGNTCSPKCTFGQFGNMTTAKCEQCQKPCESCVDSKDKCISCKISSQNNHFWLNQCVEKCPKHDDIRLNPKPIAGAVAVKIKSGYVNTFDQNNEFVCKQCNENCLDCMDSVNRCTKCRPGQLLSKYDNTCVDECQPGLAIPNDPINPTICNKCSSNCKTCSGATNNCTSCGENLLLSVREGTNYSECNLHCNVDPLKNGELENNINTMVTIMSPKGPACSVCAPTCRQCSGTPDQCMFPCESPLKFQDYKCKPECEPRDGYEYIATEVIQRGQPGYICVIKGLVCAFGYEIVAEMGDSCQLKDQVCPPGSVLKLPEKDKCIPEPTGMFPGLLLMVCVILSIPPIISKIIKRESRLVSNLIGFECVMEPAACILTIVQSQVFGIVPVVYLCVFALVFHYCTCLFFTLIYLKTVPTDTAFKHWQNYHNKVSNVLTFLGMVFSFKIYRLLFGRLFGKEEFNAVLQDPYIFYRAFNLANLFAIIFTKLPLVIAASFGLVHVGMGYQLWSTCLDLLIIEMGLFILGLIEYFQLRAELMKQSDYFKIGKKEIENGNGEEQRMIKVMGGIEELEDGEVEVDKDGNLLRTNNRVHNPKALQQHFVMNDVLQQIKEKENDLALQNEGTEAQIVRMHHKENMERQLRKCHSHREYRLGFFGSDSEDHESSEDEPFQNHISEPGTPRSKAMLQNRKFVGRMWHLNQAYKMTDQYDNCYHSVGHVQPLYDTEKANMKTQTNVLEMLGCDDLIVNDPKYLPKSPRSDSDYDEDNAAQRLIGGVLGQLESDEGDGNDQRLIRRKRIQLSQKRMAEIPNFDIEDIIGEFDIDNKGNNLIIKTKDGKLNDKYGRLVNRRGYLIDEEGNVITRRGIFIFYREEIDDDDEIPAPYCYEKKKKRLFKVEAFSEFRKQQKREKSGMNNDEYIEKEYERLKNQNGPQVFEEPTSILRSSQRDDTRARSNQKDDQDPDFLNDICEPYNPKNKGELVKGAQPKKRKATKKTAVEPQAEENLRISDGSPNRLDGSILDQDPMKNLSFMDTSKQSKRGRSGKSRRVEPQVPGLVPEVFQHGMNDLDEMYRLDMNKIGATEQAVKYDEEYIKKLTQFQKKMKSKDLRRLNRGQKDTQDSGMYGSVQRSYKSSAARGVSHEDGSGLCLARKKLNQVYGRVRQRFNNQIRQGAVLLDHHAGGLSPIDPITQANHDLTVQDQVQSMSHALEIPVRESRRAPRHHPLNTSKNTFDSEKLKDLQTIYSAHPAAGEGHGGNCLFKGHEKQINSSKSQTGLNKSQKIQPGAVRIEDNGLQNHDQVTAQLKNVHHIVDPRQQHALLEQNSRPGSAFHKTDDGLNAPNRGHIKTPKTNLMNGKYL